MFFYISYGCGGDSPRKYEKSSGIIRIIIIKKKKPAKKKKKSGNLMKRAQKNFERDPTKKNFWSSKTLRDAKAKNHEQSS